MMKYVWTLILSLGFVIPAANAQTLDLQHIYNPDANAKKDITTAIATAAKEKKHVLLQIGGNWCIWCRRFYKFVEEDTELKTTMDKNYVVYHLNYSKENKNLPVLKELGYPQRFGFPVFVILDEKGNRIHTQNSGLLEAADSYDKKKVLDMLKQWSPAALQPSNYINE